MAQDQGVLPAACAELIGTKRQRADVRQSCADVQPETEGQTMNTEELARAYYAAVNAAEVEPLLDLFTDDAVLHLPGGQAVEGKDALRQMYISTFERAGPQPQPVQIVAGADSAAVQVEVRTNDGNVLRMASFFEMEPSGKFSRVSVYRRD